MQGPLGIYPNPSNGQFTLTASWPQRYAGKQVRVEIFSVLGQRVYAAELQPVHAKWKYELRLSDGLASGRYTLRLSTHDGMAAHMPIVVQL